MDAITHRGPLTLFVELVKPSDMPPPSSLLGDKPTSTDPRKFTAVATAAMRIMANAVPKLAAIRASER
jgi:hypothetical protein